MKILLTGLLVMFFLSGCLKTRNEVSEADQKQVMQQQVTTLQKSNADVNSRFSDLEEQMRDLQGRVEVVEHKGGLSSQETETLKKMNVDQSTDLNKKMQMLQDGLTNLEKTVFQLNAEVNAMKTEQATAQAAAQAQAAAAQAEAAASEKKGSRQIAEEYFEKKDWKKAILNYQKYRDENPKGKKVPDAIYKMGVCFQELGMKDEAKTFYDEVMSKYPSSDEARRAKIREKSLKSK